MSWYLLAWQSATTSAVGSAERYGHHINGIS